MAASPGTLARAVEQAEATLGRSVAAISPPTTALELAALVGRVHVELDATLASEPALRQAHLWTPDDDEAISTLMDNFARVRAMSQARFHAQAELGSDDVADALVLAGESGALARALDQRAHASRQCAQHGGTSEQCAASAISLSVTPRTPALGGGGAGRVVLAVVAVTGVALALGALALYAQKRKHFLDGFYSPSPRRISARARRGAPRGDTYDLEVE